MAEGIGHDLEAQEPPLAQAAHLGVVLLAPGGPDHPAQDGLFGGGPGLAPAEGTEVVGAQHHVAGRSHGPQVQLVPDVPGDGGQQRIGPRPVPDQVAVGPVGGRAPGVEVGLDRGGGPDDDRGGQLAVERPGQPGAVEGDGRQVDVNDLAPGVDAGVGAPGASQRRWFDQAGGPAQGLPQRAGHGGHLRLVGETPEGGTVVGDQEPPTLPDSAGGRAHPQTNSIRAIGALSPGRGPSFKIRV